MKAVIVTCFDTYEDRVDLVVQYFKSKGIETAVVQSDFRHFKKVKREESKNNYFFINTRAYYKNLSIARLLSHHEYSRDAFKIVENMNPDILYVILPANSLAKFAGRYKKKYPNVKLYFDIMDLWPETMPFSLNSNRFPLNLWRNIRDENLKYADAIITECEYFKELIENEFNRGKFKTLYLSREKDQYTQQSYQDLDKINLCYLGSINNIIDIVTIKKLIAQISDCKPVILHIIGNGEQKSKLLEIKYLNNVEVIDYGSVYDKLEKKKIFSKCHFGLNIFKESVKVGLTMKSIDYFEEGLPIISTIKGDTSKMINEYECGYCIVQNSLEDIVDKIINIDMLALSVMRINTRTLFEDKFVNDIFMDNLNNIFQNNGI